MKQVCHLLLVLGVTLLLPPGVARAQYHIPTYLPDFMPAGIVVNNMLRNQDRMAERRRGTPQRSKASSTITEGRSSAAAQIAATYPQGDRAQLTKALERLLATYEKIEERFEIPHGDVAGALTLLLASSVEIHRGEAVDPAVVPQLLRQLRGVISSNPLFAKLSKRQRRQVHETFAILGTMMASAAAELASNPDSHNAPAYRAAAAQYLSAMLGVAADRVSISEDGFEIAAER